MISSSMFVRTPLITYVVAALISPFLITSTQGVQIGDEVTVEGYIMDTLCIDRGTLLEAPSIETLVNPERHSIHCLIDVPPCRNSGYEILADPTVEGGNYTRAYKLDTRGNQMVFERAAVVGAKCTECTGEGRQEKGYRALVSGTVTAVGLDDGTPPMMEVESLVTVMPPVQIGDEVSVEGYIMDRFCIDRGTFLDAPDVVTLESPNLHSIHCLIDVEVCRESGYEVLLDPISEDGDYRRGYRLNDNGNALLLENAKEVGICDDCDGEGTLERGYRATVTGTVTALALDDGTPPTLDVTSLVTKVIRVGDEVEVEGYIMDRFCIDRGTLLEAPDIVTLKNPDLHTIHCLIDVEVCRESGFEVLLDPIPGSDTYRRGFRVEESSIDFVIQCAKKFGICTDCSGEGTIEKGFRNKIKGVVTALALDDGTPPTLELKTIIPVLTDAGSDETSEDEEDLGDNTIRLDDNLILTFDVNDQDETVTITMTLDGIGWIGFGIGTSMIGSHAIIGLPDAPLSPSNPGTYFLGAMDVSAVSLLPDANQTLVDASITQDDGVTVMTFTKPLVEPGFPPIKASGVNHFLYAYGSDNTLGYHESRKAYALDFTAAGDGVSIVEVSDYKTQWTAHGITAFIAWGVLTPLAIAASLLRDFIPKAGLWFQIHRAFNSLTFALTIVAFILAVSSYAAVGSPHFKGNHQIVGLVMFIVASVQVLGGALRPHLPPKPTVETRTSLGLGPKYEGDVPPVEKKSQKRVMWEYAHRFVGTALLAMGFWQMQAGLKLYEIRFGGEELITLPAYWGWIIVYAAIVLMVSFIRFVLPPP